MLGKPVVTARVCAPRPVGANMPAPIEKAQNRPTVGQLQKFSIKQRLIALEQDGHGHDMQNILAKWNRNLLPPDAKCDHETKTPNAYNNGNNCNSNNNNNNNNSNNKWC